MYPYQWGSVENFREAWRHQCNVSIMECFRKFMGTLVHNLYVTGFQKVLLVLINMC